MTHILDQGDETEFVVEPEEKRAVVGGLPPEEEEPSMEQLSAMNRRMKAAPYADFSVFVPYGKKALRASKFQTYVPTLEGFMTKEISGPANFEMWLASFRVYRTALIMLGVPLRDPHQKVGEKLPGLLALDLPGRRQGTLRALHTAEVKSQLGGRCGEGLQRGQAVGVAAEGLGGRRQVIIPGTAWLAQGGRGGLPETPEEKVTKKLSGGRGHGQDRDGERQWEIFQEAQKGRQRRSRTTSGAHSLQRQAWQGERQGAGCGEVLCLEQWEWAMRGSCTGWRVCCAGEAGASREKIEASHGDLPSLVKSLQRPVLHAM